MIDINAFLLAEESKPRVAAEKGLATVAEVSPEGVKIQLAEDATPRDTFYNSLEVVSVGQIVYYVTISNTLLILGSLKY